MNSLTFKKCSLCGKLFYTYGTNLCAPCSERADKEFIMVREYISNNPGSAGINDILNNTEATERTVLYLIKEGRLSPKEVNSAEALRCSACGAAIDKGRLCSRCSAVWKQAKGNDVSERENNRGSDEQRSRTGSKMFTHDADY